MKVGTRWHRGLRAHTLEGLSWRVQGISSSCCGMLFNSRGFADAAAVMGSDLEASLLAASQGGKIPIVCDTSPCLSQIKGALSDNKLKCDACPQASP